MNPDPPRPIAKSLLVGLMLGAGVVAVCIAVILVLSILGNLLLLLLFTSMAGTVGQLLAVLTGFCVALIVGLGMVASAVTWALRKFSRWRKDAWTWAALGTGAAAAVVLAFLFAPFWLKDTATSVVTGETIAQRESLPASAAEVQHMQTVVRPAAEAGDPEAEFQLGMALLHGAAGEKRDRVAGTQWIRRAASRPEGIEARLLLAVEERAEPIPPMGRMQTRKDVDEKVAALLALQPTLPKQWLPVALGVTALIQPATYSGGASDSQAMSDRLAEAADAGSRIFRVFAAQVEESAALQFDRRGQDDEADASWRKALDGYAQAGAAFEVERLRDSSLFERLDIPNGPAINQTPRHTDAAFSQRLLRLALTLYSDGVAKRAGPSNQELAAVATLLAIERAPEPLRMDALNPPRGWLRADSAHDPLRRWLLILRHAHGDCMAAMPLADLPWRRATPSGYAWALAWGESVERCANTDQDRQQVRTLLANVRGLSQYTRFAPGQLDAVRAEVAAMIAQMR